MAVRRFLIAPLVLTTLLVVAATASASFDITLVADEDQIEPIPAGENAELAVIVIAEAANDWVCPTGGSFTIDLEVEGEDAEVGFEGDISPSVSFDVEADVYGGANDRWSGEDTATFTPKINDNVERGHLSHTYTIVATFDGSGPQGCQQVPPSQEWATADGSAQVSVEAEAPEEEEEEEDDEDGGGGGGTQGDTEEGPAPLAGLLVLTVTLTVALRRRR